jgi:pyruvate/2-oxoglutarate dehydrogenase complex dihydrolipoamide dehydrogenase (E3) component
MERRVVAEPIAVSPDDEHNRLLVDNVHPAGHVNPDPPGRYNLVAIGAGAAGLVSTAICAGLGGRAAIVEKHLMGGDCLNVGCVPSKAVIRAARAAAEVRDAGELGVDVPPGVSVDFGRVMERMRRLRARISPNDSVARFSELGVDVYLGQGRFVDDRTIVVGDRRLEFARAVVTTGARAALPPIPGLAEAGYHTNETIWSLTELPPRLAVVGGGPIGCELAQAFARFGARVTVIQDEGQILHREDRDAARIIERAMFERDGIDLMLGSTVDSVTAEGETKVLTLGGAASGRTLSVDAILIAAGRSPNVEDLALETVGVEIDPGRGIVVDDGLRTTNRRIFAAGDVASAFKFTHLADAQARIVIRNALFGWLPGRARSSKLVLPWCTYTDPEIAHVGLNAAMAAERSLEVEPITVALGDNDRSILEGDDEGFLKVYRAKGSDRIVGATVVARHAGEMIGQMTLAIKQRIGLKKLADVIQPYPTQAEVFKRAGDAYRRETFTPRAQAIFRTILAWMR